MKRFLRGTSFLLALIMLLALPAYAAETIESRASKFFGSSSVYLCNVSGNSFEAWFEVTATGTKDVLGANFIKIQQSSDGANWTTVLTYSKEAYPNLVDDNSFIHAAGVSVTVSRGYYYRAYIQLYAKDGANTGYMNRYTSAIYVPAN